MNSTNNKTQYWHRPELRKATVGFAIALSLGGLGITEVVKAQQAASNGPAPANNEIQLYGETPQPEQTQKGYVVFSNQDGRVVGAFYSPRSEFTCFAGSQDSKSLDVKPLVSEGVRTTDIEIQLGDLHRIQTVTANDQRIVSACQQTVSLASR